MHRSVGRFPTYFYSLNGRRASSGFSDFIVSIKRELPAPFGVNLSANRRFGVFDRCQQDFEPRI
jgi:hypothetical protein